MLLGLLALACGTPSTTGDPDSGGTIYSGACASCHGSDGTLGVATGGVPATSLPDVVPGATDDHLADVIQNGIRSMPATTLDDQETADVIAYLRQEWP